MDLVISKKDLLRLCARCQGVADKKAAMPALSNILLTAEGNLLRASATDMYLSVTGTTQAQVDTAGAVAVPARDLTDRVRVMPDGALHIATNATGQTTIKAVGSPRRFTLRGIPGSEFPQLPAPEPTAPRLQLPTDTLAKLLARTHFSISSDETRPHVNSALFEWNENKVRMVTTDGHRLSKMELTTELTTASASMLLPFKAITELRRIADDIRAEKPEAGDETRRTDSVHISLAGPNAFFEFGPTRFSVKLVDAQFPPYQQVIPQAANSTVRASRKALSDALEAVRIAASDRTGGVKLSTVASTLRITSESPESGAAFDELPVEYTGPELTIGFNAKYFLDVLGAIDTEEIQLAISGELDPAVIRPVPERDTESYIAVVMPMKI